MGSELLDFNVSNSNHIQHQPCSAATWTLPHIIPLPSYTPHPSLWPPANIPTLLCSRPVAVLVAAPATDVALEEPKSQ